MNKIEIVNDKIVNNSILINNNQLIIDKDTKLNIDLNDSNINLKVIIKDNIHVQILEFGISSDLEISYNIGKNSMW